MNWADATILIIVMASVVASIARGFVREALSLLTWIFAFWVAFTYFNHFVDFLKPHVSSNTAQIVISFGVLFIVTLILGGIVGHFLSTIIDRTGLSGTDRLLGIIFGLARGILLVAVLLLLAELMPFKDEAWWKQSALIPRFVPLETWLHSLLPENVNYEWPLPSR
jgi:membrane protein required for colicin V production